MRFIAHLWHLVSGKYAAELLKIIDSLIETALAVKLLAQEVKKMSDLAPILDQLQAAFNTYKTDVNAKLSQISDHLSAVEVQLAAAGSSFQDIAAAKALLSEIQASDVDLTVPNVPDPPTSATPPASIVASKTDSASTTAESPTTSPSSVTSDVVPNESTAPASTESSSSTTPTTPTSSPESATTGDPHVIAVTDGSTSTDSVG